MVNNAGGHHGIMPRSEYATQSNIDSKVDGWIEEIKRRGLPTATEFMEKRPALIVTDMQRYFTSPEGGAFIPASRAIIPRLRALVTKFRENELPVIFTRHGHHKIDKNHPLIRWWEKDIVLGEQDSELDPDIGQNEGVVITKEHYSAHRNPKFGDILRENNCKSVVIAGVMTNLCCETTARDAFMENYDVYFLADGTATVSEEMHVATLRNISYGFGRVVRVSEVLELLE